MTGLYISRELLLRLVAPEWVSTDRDYRGSYCPWCDEEEHAWHKPDCARQEAMKLLKPCVSPDSSDIIPRLLDLEKWYGFIQTTDQMIESNQIISGAEAEIQELRERNQKLTNELAKWESGGVFSQHAAQLYEQLRARVAELEAENTLEDGPQ
jgi:hypothetical protein